MNTQSQVRANGIQDESVTLTQTISAIVPQYTLQGINHPINVRIYPPLLANTDLTDLYLVNRGSSKVVIKYWRVHTKPEIEQETFLKNLSSGVQKWIDNAGLHQNIVCPLSKNLQVISDLGVPPGVSSLYMQYYYYGNALKYLRDNVNASALVIIAQVASALAFLPHQRPPIIHGRLHSGNILISDKRGALLSDIGVYKAYSDTQLLCWAAPELCDDNRASETCASDVYSFAMASLELLTKRRPWYAYTNRFIVPDLVLHGVRPGRPSHYRRLGIHCADQHRLKGFCLDEIMDGVAPEPSDEVWEIITRCWSHDATQRPTVAEVVMSIAKLLN